MSQSPTRLSRRTMFAGAGAASAVAAVAALLPSRSPQADAPAAAPPRPAPQRGGGYTLSDHVKQYYKSTRV